MINELMSQRNALVGVVHPVSLSAGNTSTASIDLSKGRQFMFKPSVGTLGVNGTVDFIVTGCTITNGTFVNINATAITQIAAANTTALVVVRADQVNALGLGYKFIQGKITTAVNASVVAVDCWASDVTYDPASQYNLAAAGEIIVL